MGTREPNLSGPSQALESKLTLYSLETRNLDLPNIGALFVIVDFTDFGQVPCATALTVEIGHLLCDLPVISRTVESKIVRHGTIAPFMVRQGPAASDLDYVYL